MDIKMKCTGINSYLDGYSKERVYSYSFEKSTTNSKKMQETAYFSFSERKKASENTPFEIDKEYVISVG